MVFFATYSSSWKYDYVYEAFFKHPRFNPIILICPVITYGKEYMLERMSECLELFNKKGYQTILSYNSDKNEYIDIKKDIDADIIFYTNPYKGLIHDRYYIDKFYEYITCYVPYAFDNSSGDHATNIPFLNVVSKLYVETSEHQLHHIRNSRNKGENTIVTGYPGIESFIDKSRKIDSTGLWKCSDNKKKIIWAPHHTFDPVGVVFYSCFLMYYQTMIDLAKKYNNEIQIAFKPHPLLRVKLENFWGKCRTEEYYNTWSNLPNTTLVEGDYVDLFLTSDAMIHDSGSFLIEYLYVNKPVIRTHNGIDTSTILNSFAQRCIEQAYYQAYNADDIEKFIQNVIHGVDDIKIQREKFIENYLSIPGGNSPSQNIVDDLINSIDSVK